MTKVKELILGVIIAIIFLMFCVFGTKLIYDSPNYEDYCDYGRINGNFYPMDEKPLNASQMEAQENAYKECYDDYDIANESYSKKMFIISLIFGMLVILGCAIFININSISGGLMFGSLMFILYGTGGYWSYMDDLIRFIILGVSLGLLIYVAYWINKRKDNTHKKKKRKNGRRIPFSRR